MGSAKVQVLDLLSYGLCATFRTRGFYFVRRSIIHGR